VRTILAGRLLRVALSVASGPALAVPIPVSPLDFELDGPGTNVDDACFWVDPTDAGNSLVFVTPKGSPFVEAFRATTGALVGTIPGFNRPNNCAVEDDLLLTTDRDPPTAVRVHHLPDFAFVTNFGLDLGAPMGIDVLTMPSGERRVYVTDTDDSTVHVYRFGTWELLDVFPSGMGAGIEPIFADDLYQRIYVSRGDTAAVNDFGVFEPDGTLVQTIGAGTFVGDVEGIALHACGPGGYLVVTDQQANPSEFEVYDRATLGHLLTFTLADALGEVVDGTDGIDILETPVPGFPAGMFAACDGCGDSDPETMDVIGWDRIAALTGLAACPSGRAVTCGNGVVDPPFEECDGATGICPATCRSDCACAPGTAPTTTTTTLPPPPTGALDLRVSAGVDDAEEASSGAVNLASTDLELVQDTSTQTVGIRFRTVQIPPGSTILAAHVQFEVDETGSVATSLAIRGLAADNALPFTTAARDISSRPRTSASVPWTPPGWPTIGTAGAARMTPSLVPIIQEIINRSGWASNNAVGFVITGSGKRVARAFEGSTAGAPLLHVHFLRPAMPTTTSTTTSSTTTTTTTQTITTTTTTERTTTTVETSTTTTEPSTTTTETTTTTTATVETTTTTEPSTTTVTTTTSTTEPTTTTAATTTTNTTTTASPTTTTTLPPPIAVNVRVSAGADDAEETASGAMELSSGDLELVQEATAQKVGMRFANVPVPPGATILAAWVQFQVDEAGSAAAALVVQGDSRLEPPAFTTGAGNVSSRPRTAAAVSWSPAAWPTVGAAGTAQRTASLVPLIQELVNRPGWTAGKAIALIVTGTGARVAEAFEGLPTAAPILHIDYRATGVPPDPTTTTTTMTATTATTTTVPPPVSTLDLRVVAAADDAEESASGAVTLTSSDLELVQEVTTQTVGLRFRNVTVPRAATIVAAWVQFEVDEVNTAATSLALRGEAQNQAAVFTTVTRNISSRVRTVASVSWTPTGWTSVGAAGLGQRTPSLAPIIQEIVNRPGWASGNPLALIVTGTGRRVAGAFDGRPAGAALLHLEYR
jgi:hypothetical protein